MLNRTIKCQGKIFTCVWKNCESPVVFKVGMGMAFSNWTGKTADLGDNLRDRGSTDFKILQ